MIEGHTAQVVESNFPQFSVGAQYVLFLRYDPLEKLFVVPYGGQGSFAIENGYVRQLKGDFAATSGKVTAAGFTLMIAQRIRPPVQE